MEPAPYRAVSPPRRPGIPNGRASTRGVIEVRTESPNAPPAADGAFDAAAATLVLCSLADQRAALREMHRVVRPGALRFIEHVQADTPGLRRVQRMLDATVWPPLGGGAT